MVVNVYRIGGLLLLMLGSVLVFLGWFIVSSVYLVVSGLAFILVGVICILVSIEFSVNPEPYRILSERGILNLRLLVESLELENSKPIYLPSSMVSSGLPLALIPIGEGSFRFKRRISTSFISRYGGSLGDVGILTATTGTIIIRDFGGFSRVESPSGLEGTLSSILVHRLKVASQVQVVSLGNGVFRVKISSPSLWMVRYKPFGSFYTETVGQIVAECLDKPVKVFEEKISRREVILRVETVGV